MFTFQNFNVSGPFAVYGGPVVYGAPSTVEYLVVAGGGSGAGYAGGGGAG